MNKHWHYQQTLSLPQKWWESFLLLITYSLSFICTMEPEKNFSKNATRGWFCESTLWLLEITQCPRCCWHSVLCEVIPTGSLRVWSLVQGREKLSRIWKWEVAEKWNEMSPTNRLGDWTELKAQLYLKKCLPKIGSDIGEASTLTGFKGRRVSIPLSCQD